ncbi:MAG: hypothetical protein K2X39_07395, partial [Silvanigrellaceae bacterium]|nr:hypothetical protein [Silvanigrellaceae bacterium]
MLTEKRWGSLLAFFLSSILVYVLSLILVSLFFSSRLNYLGNDISSILFAIIKMYPLLVLKACIKIFFVTFFMCFFLSVITFAYRIKVKFLFGCVFFFASAIRMGVLYPAVSEKWILIQHFDFLRKIFEKASLLPLNSKSRIFIEIFPFVILSLIFLANLFLYLKILIEKSKEVKLKTRSIHVNELDKESKLYGMHGLTFAFVLIFGSFFVFKFSPLFDNEFPENPNKENTNVFIFAIDSLRYDRIIDKKYTEVMPFLHSLLPTADLVKPMAVGIARTFPSWVEIATGNYALTTGVRSMFPSRHARLNPQPTMFSLAQNAGYKTIAVSDFAGDIFPRFPFGIEVIDAPTSNL